MVQIFKYQTVGTEVYDYEMGPTIGYDNIQEGYVIVPEEYDDFDFECINQLTLITEVPTIGL